jgi:hypothetical protein
MLSEVFHTNYWTVLTHWYLLWIVPFAWSRNRASVTGRSGVLTLPKHLFPPLVYSGVHLPYSLTCISYKILRMIDWENVVDTANFRDILEFAITLKLSQNIYRHHKISHQRYMWNQPYLTSIPKPTSYLDHKIHTVNPKPHVHVLTCTITITNRTYIQ